MQVNRNDTVLSCAICERTLLLGERGARVAPNGGGGGDDEGFVDVCQLCHDTALEYGWLKEGSPTTPTIAPDRKRSRFSLGSFLGARGPAAPIASEPFLRRRSEAELAIVEAADRFNAKSLGSPSVSIHPLSGVNADVVVTVAWDISWYQYRVTADSAPVRLAERGHDPAELEVSFTDWNAHLEEDGRVVPDIARL